MRGFIDNSGPFVTDTLAALLWANSGLESYERFARLLHFPVNDIAIFFAVGILGAGGSLFFATAAFPAGDQLAETKMGALLSFSAAIPAIAAALVLRVGRFGPSAGLR